jgi:hypothetical protein
LKVREAGEGLSCQDIPGDFHHISKVFARPPGLAHTWLEMSDEIKNIVPADMREHPTPLYSRKNGVFLVDI